MKTKYLKYYELTHLQVMFCFDVTVVTTSAQVTLQIPEVWGQQTLFEQLLCQKNCCFCLQCNKETSQQLAFFPHCSLLITLLKTYLCKIMLKITVFLFHRCIFNEQSQWVLSSLKNTLRFLWLLHNKVV